MYIYMCHNYIITLLIYIFLFIIIINSEDVFVLKLKY